MEFEKILPKIEKYINKRAWVLSKSARVEFDDAKQDLTIIALRYFRRLKNRKNLKKILLSTIYHRSRALSFYIKKKREKRPSFCPLTLDILEPSLFEEKVLTKILLDEFTKFLCGNDLTIFEMKRKGYSDREIAGSISRCKETVGRRLRNMFYKFKKVG